MNYKLSGLDEYISRLEDRCSKMSFLLGMAHAGIISLLLDPKVAEFQKDKIREIDMVLSAEITKLFYQDETNES